MLRRSFLQLFPVLVYLGLHLPESPVVWPGSHGPRLALGSVPKSSGSPVLISERGHLFDCSSCLFAREGKDIVTGGIGDETAILWDATTAKELRRFNHGRQIWDLAINSKHGQLLTCGADHEAKLWDLATGGLLQRFRKHKDVVITAAFDASGETVFTIGRDCLICVWSPRSSKLLHSFRLPFSDLQAARFDVCGTTVVGRFKDKSLKVFDPQNGNFLKDLEIPKTDPRAINEGSTEHPIVVNRDASLVAAHALYSGLVVYDIASGQQLWSHPFLGDIAMAFTLDSSCLLVMSSEFDSLSQPAHTTPSDFAIETSRISFFEARSGKIENDVTVYHGHYKDALRTQDVAFRPDGEAFVAADTNGTARVFQVSDGKELLRLRRDNHPISSIAISPDGTSLVVADSRPDIGILDLTVGAFVGSLGPLEIQAKSVRFTNDGKAVVADENNLFRIWNTSNRKPIVHLNRQTQQGWLYPVRDDGTLALRFPAQGPHIDPDNAFAHSTLLRFSIWSRSISVTVCNPQSQQDKGGFLLTADNFGPALFGPDRESVFAVLGDRVAKLDLRAPRISWISPPQKDNINDLAVSSDGGRVLTAGNDGFAVLWNANTGALIHQLKAHPDGVTAAAFSPDGNYLLTGGIDGNASLWSGNGVRIRLLTGHAADVTCAAFVPNHGFVATGSSDGTVRLWTVPGGSWVCTLRRTELGGWAVVAPDGRFDTDNLDEVKGLHWVFNDDPYHALAPEQYLRDFYEPGLLSRLLFSTAPDGFRSIRSLESLNRAVPKKPLIRILPDGNAETVTAEVDVNGDSYVFEQSGLTNQTGVYDLHLLRDGQLIREFPEPKDTTPDGVTGPELKQWRNDKLVVDYPANRTVTFQSIKLPHRADGQPVKFTAYSFNCDRVRSDIGLTPAATLAGRPNLRAFVVAIGVDNYGGSGWDLRFAAKDANSIGDLLPSQLETVGFKGETYCVISDNVHQEASKQGIQSAIESIANLASPDDMVFILFSGHGYSGTESDFYLLPSDSRPAEINWNAPSSSDLTRLVSAKDLARWFRGMDAQEIVFVIDACHAAASVDAPGFRPGPLGVAGLGQLAYDKRMRVLAASQTNQSADEIGGKIQHGILTYALVYEGLVARQGKGDDGTITLASWLRYGATRVPSLFTEAQGGEINDFDVPALKGVIVNQTHRIPSEHSVQKPVLFDFKKDDGITIVPFNK